MNGITENARTVVTLLVCCAICSIYLLTATTIGPSSLWIGGFLVSDGITLWEYALLDRSTTAIDLVKNYQAGAVLAVINATAASWSPLAPFILNTILLAFISVTVAKNNAKWGIFLLPLIPYYIASALLPSKDIVVAAFFIIFTNLFLRSDSKAQITAFIVAGVMYFVRDGYALILMISLICILLSERLNFQPHSLLLFVIGGSAFFWTAFEVLFSDAFLFVRAINVAEQGQTLNPDSLRGPGGYFVRLFGNATNLAFRPVFFDIRGRFDVLSIFYSLSGVTLVCALIACYEGLSKKALSDRRLGQLGLLTLALVSVTPYVQPRYLLPICLLLPAYSFVTTKWFISRYIIVALAGCMAASIYIAIGIYPPSAQVVSYVWGTTP